MDINPITLTVNPLEIHLTMEVPFIGISTSGPAGPAGASITLANPANGLTLSGGVLGITIASATSYGALSPTDWIAFNAKQPAGDYLLPAALAPYLTSASAANTYQTIAGMSGYLTISGASSTYQTIAGMSNYLTISAAGSTYQTIAGMSSYLTTTAAADTYQPKGSYLVASDLTPYLTISGAAAIYQTISGMSSYLTTATAASTYQTQSGMSAYLAATGATRGATSQAQELTSGAYIGNYAGGSYLTISGTGAWELFASSVSKASISNLGALSLAGGVTVAGTFRSSASGGCELYGTSWGLSSTAVDRIGVNLQPATNTRTGGTQVAVAITPTYNQAAGSTTANTDFRINRTETAIGSGAQLFLDLQVGGVSKASISNIGSLTLAGSATIVSDSFGLTLGAGADMKVSYDGTIGKIDSSLVAPSDIHLTTGAAKTLVLDTVVWRDQLGAALSLQQSGPGISRNIPEGSVDYTTAANQADYMVENFQFNHDRKAGTSVLVHIHWLQSQTNTPNWAIQYRWQLAGAAQVTAWTAAKWTANAFTWASGTLNQISEFAAITPAANEGVSPILQVRFIRDTTNALGLAFAADPYTATVGVIAVDAHYQIDTIGSRTEFSK